MVFLLRRELLIQRKLRFLFAAALVALSAACGGNTGASEGGDGNTGASGGAGSAGGQEPAAGAPASAALSSPIENGDPMPSADENGGVPPYPGAVVWTIVPPPPSEFHVVNAFTSDTFPTVVEFYDQALADWRRTVAEDAVHYHRDPNLASVIISPWSGEKMGEEGPEELQDTRTSIGIAWQEGP